VGKAERLAGLQDVLDALALTGGIGGCQEFYLQAARTICIPVDVATAGGAGFYGFPLLLHLGDQWTLIVIACQAQASILEPVLATIRIVKWPGWYWG
jgi:hypothetical protein